MLKQLWKNVFMASAFFLSSVIVSVLHERVGIFDELLPFSDLTADQNFVFLILGQVVDVLPFCFP